MDFRRSIATRQTKRAAVGASGRLSYLGFPPVPASQIDAMLRTAGELVASINRVGTTVVATRQETASAAASDHALYAMRGEVESMTLRERVVGEWRSTEGVLALLD